MTGLDAAYDEAGRVAACPTTRGAKWATASHTLARLAGNGCQADLRRQSILSLSLPLSGSYADPACSG